MRRRGYQRVQGESLMKMLASVQCDHCAGRGFQLDYDDPGGVMRAVPGDTCRHCNGTGESVSAARSQAGGE